MPWRRAAERSGRLRCRRCSWSCFWPRQPPVRAAIPSRPPRSRAGVLTSLSFRALSFFFDPTKRQGLAAAAAARPASTATTAPATATVRHGRVNWAAGKGAPATKIQGFARRAPTDVPGGGTACGVGTYSTSTCAGSCSQCGTNTYTSASGGATSCTRTPPLSAPRLPPPKLPAGLRFIPRDFFVPKRRHPDA